jgi:uncharacterized membrane-anchored protein
MLKTILILSLAIFISTCIVWLIDHNGEVLIHWLGYEIKADIIAAVFLAITFTILVFLVSYIITRLLAIKFPSLLKSFFKKTYIHRLEKLVSRNRQSFDLISETLLAINAKDYHFAENSYKKFAKLIKNPNLNNFLQAKIYAGKNDLQKAELSLAKINENKHTKVFSLELKMDLAIERLDHVSAIAYGKQILTINKKNIQTAEKLLALYRQNNFEQEAKNLILLYPEIKR